MSNPVQVILNSKDFMEFWNRPPGGSNKDFFADRDADFIQHQTKLQTQLTTIYEGQLRQSDKEITYGKVVLQPEALAKSHHPTDKLFTKSISPVVGGAKLGELLVEFTKEAIQSLIGQIASAESETRYLLNENEKKGKPKPSKIKSEVGSIREILPYEAADKRNFKISDAIDWLSDERSGGAYIVELFPTNDNGNREPNSPARRRLMQNFKVGLSQLGNGLEFARIPAALEEENFYYVKFTDSDRSPQINFQSSELARKNKLDMPDLNGRKHNRLLKFLDEHPLVKKIALPPLVTKNSVAASATKGKPFPLLKKVESQSYPLLGIVDGGVSKLFNDWVITNTNILDPKDKDESHATFIAGIAIAGQSLNGNIICKELDGCNIIDIDIFPDRNYGSYYPEPLGFFSQLESCVKEMVAATGLRVINFSLNFDEHANSDAYSITAHLLDKIAVENDVIFVISAGNANPCRKEWPEDDIQALSILAASRQDNLKVPAESCRNLSVAALNPPNLKGIIPFTLANYSCRGALIRTGVKPDLAHIGGAGISSATGTGLKSFDVTGNTISECGTSYAAPGVAKFLASLDHAIEGEVPRETLIAIAIHNAALPDRYQTKSFRNIAKHLVGFGIPAGSEEILNGNANAITLVFHNTIQAGRKMNFKFSWPSCLTKNGSCRGRAKLTLVCCPPLDHNYGAEFVRVNVEGALRQLQEDGKYKGKLKPVYAPQDKSSHLYEKEQVEYGFKWSPVKVYENSFPQGIGKLADWSLDIEYLERDGVKIPLEGVKFTAILTISDLDKKELVFTNMKQQLQSLGVKVQDIQTAARITPRI